MESFELIAGILYQGLIAWNHHKSEEMQKELLELVEERDEELRKPSWETRHLYHLYPDYKLKNFRDNNVIDSHDLKLRRLGEAYLIAKNGGEDLRSLINS